MGCVSLDQTWPKNRQGLQLKINAEKEEFIHYTGYNPTIFFLLEIWETYFCLTCMDFLEFQLDYRPPKDWDVCRRR